MKKRLGDLCSGIRGTVDFLQLKLSHHPAAVTINRIETGSNGLRHGNVFDQQKAHFLSPGY